MIRKFFFFWSIAFFAVILVTDSLAANRSVLPAIPGTEHQTPQTLSTPLGNQLDRLFMHPGFALLDEAGNPVRNSGGEISSNRTCGQCHDVEYINKRNTHFNETVKADCIGCHFREGQIYWDQDSFDPKGNLKQSLIRIFPPRNKTCASCHSVVHDNVKALALPDTFRTALDYELTQKTGEIISSQNLSESMLNIAGKNELNYPWDVHARRQVLCVACHYPQNDPRRCSAVRSTIDYLTNDPRRAVTFDRFLYRPDHNLLSTDCLCCHNPLVSHDSLPYKQKHLQVLSCQSCHVPRLYGPALKVVDRTVLTPTGDAKIEFRGTDAAQSHGISMNTQYITGYTPFLFPHEAGRSGHSISPFNLVTHWFWKSKKTQTPVSMDILTKVYFSSEAYAPDILNVFDKDKNNILSVDEMILDSDGKIDFVRAKLVQLGIKDPIISGEVQAHQINHGVVSGKMSVKDCSGCHGTASRFGGNIDLAGFTPTGTIPALANNAKPIINGKIVTKPGGGILISREPHLAGHYVFGHTRFRGLNTTGLLILGASLLGILGHASLRYYNYLRRPRRAIMTQKVYMYPFYERLWHWTMAFTIIILMVTGFEIHYTGRLGIFGMANAVSIHNTVAFIMVANAFLSLFYHLATGEIRQFFNVNRSFVKEIMAQIVYYTSGIFKGTPHPVEKTVKRKLNPLQQITYVGLLNLIFPFQIVTGLMIWTTGKWPELGRTIGGLTYIGPLHNFGAWLFVTFLVVHIYLTTTGHTVWANLKAMITGTDVVEIHKHKGETDPGDS